MLKLINLGNSSNQWRLLFVIFCVSLVYTINELNKTKNQYFSKIFPKSDRQYSRLSKDIQARIHELQNPPDCSQSRRVIIYDDTHTFCGFGCFIHQVARLLQLAYLTNRTLIVKNTSGLSLFQNYTSENCQHWKKFTQIHENVYKKDIIHDQVLIVNNWDINLEVKKFMANWTLAHATELTNQSADPQAWIYSQFIYYMTRFKPSFMRKVSEFLEKKNFSPECVGIHVRRTDKIQEANYYSLEDYMKQVELYLVSNRQKPVLGQKHCVVVTSDEPKVINEAVEK